MTREEESKSKKPKQEKQEPKKKFPWGEFCAGAFTVLMCTGMITFAVLAIVKNQEVREVQKETAAINKVTAVTNDLIGKTKPYIVCDYGTVVRLGKPFKQQRGYEAGLARMDKYGYAVVHIDHGQVTFKRKE